MEVAAGEMSPLLRKLGELLVGEYNLEKRVRQRVQSLGTELELMHAALLKVGEVPRDQLVEEDLIWAGKVRELSYDMEDAVDKFMVRVEDDGDRAEPTNLKNKVKKFLKKTTKLFSKGKALHQIADAIQEAQEFAMELAEQRKRYHRGEGSIEFMAATIEGSEPAANQHKLKQLMKKMGKAFTNAIKDIKNPCQKQKQKKGFQEPRVARHPFLIATIDPRLKAMYKDVSEFVGIDGKRDDELIKLLSEGDDDDVSKKKLKIVSIVGFGGLGKTTLATAVYDKIKGDFDCSAFVQVGRKPDVKKVLRDILLDLNHTNSNLTIFDERHLINEIQKFLENKRYLIVIDDIWDKELWGHINCAFCNVNIRGSRLITTTRKDCVSQACCSSKDDIYEMKPLSNDDSQRLFYRRVFQCENECPSKLASELEQVSRDILKKCGGVPLAIITIANLLASNRNITSKDRWLALLHAFGSGLMVGASVNEMRSILSFSYDDLPSHLKTCLLYLSIFPGDYKIEREGLIWRWIAEGFVQCDQKQEISLFEIGESYFIELINRSMIQPVYDGIGGVYACRVHNMMLDFICSLSSEGNFVTILDGTEQSTPNSQSKVRRLSLQHSKADQTTTLGSLSTSQVRSITLFEAAINVMPPLSSFDVLRVLDLNGCDLGENDRLNLSDVGNLCHLRYLDLKNTCIRELPAEIGKLQFLQVLDLRANSGLKEIPSTVAKLRRLMWLRFPRDCKWLPDVLGSLTCIEVLEEIYSSLDIVTELRNLTRLRELCIRFDRESLETEEAFVESLCYLHNLQSLAIHGSFKSGDLLGEGWMPPPHLRRFDLTMVSRLSALPAWIKRNPSHLWDLTELRIGVKELKQEDLRILGSLLALRSIHIWSLQQTQRLILIEGFPCTVVFELIFYGFSGVIMFRPGALPCAEKVEFTYSVRAAKDEGKGDFDLGLGNLPSLRKYYVRINGEGATVGEAKKAEAALRHAADIHRNHPYLQIDFSPSIEEGAADDDIC